MSVHFQGKISLSVFTEVLAGKSLLLLGAWTDGTACGISIKQNWSQVTWLLPGLPVGPWLADLLPGAQAGMVPAGSPGGLDCLHNRISSVF